MFSNSIATGLISAAVVVLGLTVIAFIVRKRNEAALKKFEREAAIRVAASGRVRRRRRKVSAARARCTLRLRRRMRRSCMISTTCMSFRRIRIICC